MNNETSVKAYRYTVLGMSFLEKILGSKITVEGLENIPSHPVLFVSNHFTRSETFVVPYIIYKYTKRQVRCLADSGLFHGVLGRFLKSVGAISTKNAKRNVTIISDLMKGRYDWMIYPEGSMIKNKEIYIDNKSSYSFGDFDVSGEARVRTGSAMLALKSELYRADLIDANRKNNADLLKYYKTELGVEYEDNLQSLQTHIVPLTITYYPIRPGKNIIQKIVGRIFNTMPAQLSEELEIEGNILLSSNINISFGKAINLAEYTNKTRAMIYPIPIISNETKINMILKYLKYRLTNQFMEEIYSSTKINIDHLVAAILHFYPQNQISIDHLKALTYLSLNNIVALKKYHINSDIFEENLCHLLSGENFPEFESVINLAKMTGIIVEDQRNFVINKEKLNQKYNFQQIRLENTLQVILNEFLLLKIAVDAIKRNVLMSENDVRRRSFNYVLSNDLANFEKDYKKYYDANLSKDKTIGIPFFLDSTELSNQNKNGILLVHGYLSSPKEMIEMAKYFNNLGFKIYCVRLAGHATAPINLEDVKWQDWYASLNRGYAALKLICEKVFIVGFSTGGLLALVAAVRKNDQKNNQIDGIICINPALKLRDIRARFASSVHLWNDVLKKLHIEKGQFRYAQNNSESPEFNYSQNYIKGVEQLELLMDYCEEILEKINCKVLVIQSKNDHVVDSVTSKNLLKQIPSTSIIFEEIESTKHSIVKGEMSIEVFEKIEKIVNSWQLEVESENQTANHY